MLPTWELLALPEAERDIFFTKCHKKKNHKYPEQVTGMFIFSNLNYFKSRTTLRSQYNSD